MSDAVALRALIDALQDGAPVEVTYTVPVVWVNAPSPRRSREPVPVVSTLPPFSVNVVNSEGTMRGDYAGRTAEVMFLRRDPGGKRVAIAIHAVTRIAKR